VTARHPRLLQLVQDARGVRSEMLVEPIYANELKVLPEQTMLNRWQADVRHQRGYLCCQMLAGETPTPAPTRKRAREELSFNHVRMA
jgi:hypothetical protein